MTKRKQRSVSRSPEWAERAMWNPSLECYAHGLEVCRAERRARLYVAEGSPPRPVHLAAVLNMLEPNTTFADVVDTTGKTIYIMINNGQWRGGEPLEDYVVPMPEGGALLRLPAITGRPQYAGPNVRREDRPGIAA